MLAEVSHQLYTRQVVILGRELRKCVPGRSRPAVVDTDDLEGPIDTLQYGAQSLYKRRDSVGRTVYGYDDTDLDAPVLAAGCHGFLVNHRMFRFSSSTKSGIPTRGQ